ncbi:MAG: hypothetical protein WC169_03290 [Dehalococcoidia bacterium]
MKYNPIVPVPVLQDPTGKFKQVAMTEMERINLEPNYTCNEVPGRCLKCLAEKELDNCLFALLSEQSSDEELQQRYEALLALLESPDLEKLRSEAERLLSEGKQVKVKVDYDAGNLQCKLIVD